MKRLGLYFCLLMLATKISAQEVDKSLLAQQYKNKRTTNLIVGWGLLGSGTGLIVAGVAMDPGAPTNPLVSGFTGGYKNSWDKASLILAGILMAGTSLVFFEFANRNKDKILDLGLSAQQVSQLNSTASIQTTIPAFTMKLKL